MGKDALQQLKNEGIFISDRPALKDSLLDNSFMSFVHQNESYKRDFLQKNYSYAFDGFSFKGQTDSSNQGYDDLMDTFVFSDLCAEHKFPAEFDAYFENEWNDTLSKIEKWEEVLLAELDLNINTSAIGHMVSCNYYPATRHFQTTSRGNTRLSAHPDVSLFTVFPFGVESGFTYKNPRGEWVELGKLENWTVFPGYFLECLTNGDLKALEHKVVLPIDRDLERTSYAFFSLPRPNTEWAINGMKVTPENYFEKYLNLF